MQDGLRFAYEVGAQGGHYRTAATCVAGNAVGLTEHDTESSAQATLRGEIEFVVERSAPARLVWSAMPAHARYKLSKVDEEVKAVEMQGDGSKTFSAKSGKAHHLVISDRRVFVQPRGLLPAIKDIDARIQVIR